jgi:predicted Zn-ribbon and HTH transcriptional regulator
MSTLYKIIFTGQLQTGIDPEQAVRDFATTFKVSHEKASQLIQTERETVLKSDIEFDNAKRYQKVLEDLGLCVEIKPANQHASSKETNNHPKCPRCQSQHIEKDRCQQCGLLVEQFSIYRSHRPHDHPSLTTATNTGHHHQNSLQKSIIVSADTPSLAIHLRPVHHGWQWLKQGWHLVYQYPAAWVGSFGILLLINLMLVSIPLLGSMIATVLGPVFLGGLMHGAHNQMNGEPFYIRTLMAGFLQPTLTRLLKIGSLYLSGNLIIAIVMVLSIDVLDQSFSLNQLMDVTAPPDPQHMISIIGVTLLIGLLLFIPLLMAYWFAPVLIMLHDQLSPWAAMKLSYQACQKNWLPLTWYGLIILCLMVLTMVMTLSIGLIVVMPVVIASLYASYNDLFSEWPLKN